MLHALDGLLFEQRGLLSFFLGSERFLESALELLLPLVLLAMSSFSFLPPKACEFLIPEGNATVLLSNWKRCCFQGVSFTLLCDSGKEF